MNKTYVVDSVSAPTKANPYRRKIYVNGIDSKITHNGLDEEAMDAFLREYLNIKRDVSQYLKLHEIYPMAVMEKTVVLNKRNNECKHIIFNIEIPKQTQ